MNPDIRPPHPRRSYSSNTHATRSPHELQGITATETSPLLLRQRTTPAATSVEDFADRISHGPESTSAAKSYGDKSPENSRSRHSRTGSLRRFLSSTLGLEHRFSYYPTGTPRDPQYHAGSYDQFTSIDWMRDAISDSLRQQEIRARKGYVGNLKVRLHALQGWILAALVGIFTAAITYLIDVVEAYLFDAKYGYCSGSPLKNQIRCCSGSVGCDDWITWGEAWGLHKNTRTGVNFALCLAFMLIMALLSCLLVLSDKRIIPRRRAGAYADKSIAAGLTSSAETNEDQIVLYPSAGSGVAEVKVIASGFILHGFLGAKALVIKVVGCILSVGSGLSIGKEGPYVHIAACIGNVFSRAFPVYHLNEGRKREIITASSAAGIAVAFGAPISGVVFSLEEVSYSFPTRTLFRTFFCSIIAAISLKFLNPYLNGKIVPFEARYTSDWRAYEMPVFVALGVLGGAIGALFVKGTRLWTKIFRGIPFIQKSPLFETALIALVTCIFSYWNVFTRLPVGQLMSALANDCKSFHETGTGICPTADEIPSLISKLGIAFLIKCILTIITVGVKVPAGIYVPSMVIGGLFGRAVGHAIQYAIINIGDRDLFGYCSSGETLEGCVVPGVYAMITAGATMGGVTRLSLTLVLILFELTGSLDHVLPFSIAVLVAKLTADALESQSVYDLYMDMHDYPYMDNKTRPNFTSTLADLTPRVHSRRIIDISSSPLVPASLLQEKLNRTVEAGQFDGGLPILKNDTLIGMISCQDLAFCLDRLGDQKANERCLVSPRVMRYEIDEDEEGDEEDSRDHTDFTEFIDPAPVALDIHSSNEVVYDCFVKLGLRYICVLRDGHFVGFVHRKAFVKYVREA